MSLVPGAVEVSLILYLRSKGSVKLWLRFGLNGTWYQTLQYATIPQLKNSRYAALDPYLLLKGISPYSKREIMTFTTLGLSEPIDRSLNEKGYTVPSEIQKQAIPAILAGSDVMAAAKTGSGKTGAFLLPMLQMLSEDGNPVQPNSIKALILTPTRELAAQVCESAEIYGKYLKLHSTAVYGGVKINPQMMRLRKGVDILVATPGRLLDLYSQNAVKFNQVEILVLDEADRMLDMGFIHDINKIMKLLPKKRQTLMFSATFSAEIRELTKGVLNQPVQIDASPRNATAENIKQVVYTVSKSQKASLLSRLIKDGAWFQVLVFARTKHGANRIVEKLLKDDISALAIHGNKSQGARTKALANFKKGLINVLVATDIAARGLDIAELPHVVNYDLPNIPEDYVHRIGRTGRAGRDGEACSLVSQDEKAYLRDIQKLIKLEIPVVHNAGYEDLENVPVVEREPRPVIVRSRGSDKKPRTSSARSPRKDTAARKPRANSDKPKTYAARSERGDSQSAVRPKSYEARGDRSDSQTEKPRSYVPRGDRSDSRIAAKPRAYEARSERSDSRTEKPRSYAPRGERTDSRTEKPRSYAAPRGDRSDSRIAAKPRAYEARSERNDSRTEKPRGYAPRGERSDNRTAAKPRAYEARGERADSRSEKPRGYAPRGEKSEGYVQKPRTYSTRGPRSDSTQKPKTYVARGERSDDRVQKPRSSAPRGEKPEGYVQKPRTYSTRGPRSDGAPQRPKTYAPRGERPEGARPRLSKAGPKKPSGPRKPK